MSRGEQLKLRGMELAANKFRPTLIRAQCVAEMLGLRGEAITAEDVRKAYQQHYDEPLNIGNAMGSIFDSEKWEPCGRVKAKRTAAHGRYIQSWRIKSGKSGTPRENS